MRYLASGYKVIAITDHADYSNYKTTIASVLEFVNHWPKDAGIKVLAGVELTHLPAEQFRPLSGYARKKGINVIVAHGETQVEPVISGTNRAALEADIDILAHPGMITDDDTKFAAKKGVFLEITSRKGHSQTNAHVAKQALKFGAKLILNNDSHQPEDVISPEELINTGRQAGLTEKDIEKIYRDIESFIKAKGVHNAKD